MTLSEAERLNVQAKNQAIEEDRQSKESLINNVLQIGTDITKSLINDQANKAINNMQAEYAEYSASDKAFKDENGNYITDFEQVKANYNKWVNEKIESINPALQYQVRKSWDSVNATHLGNLATRTNSILNEQRKANVTEAYNMALTANYDGIDIEEGVGNILMDKEYDVSKFLGFLDGGTWQEKLKNNGLSTGAGLRLIQYGKALKDYGYEDYDISNALQNARVSFVMADIKQTALGTYSEMLNGSYDESAYWEDLNKLLKQEIPGIGRPLTWEERNSFLTELKADAKTTKAAYDEKNESTFYNDFIPWAQAYEDNGGMFTTANGMKALSEHGVNYNALSSGDRSKLAIAWQRNDSIEALAKYGEQLQGLSPEEAREKVKEIGSSMSSKDRESLSYFFKTDKTGKNIVVKTTQEFSRDLRTVIAPYSTSVSTDKLESEATAVAKAEINNQIDTLSGILGGIYSDYADGKIHTLEDFDKAVKESAIDLSDSDIKEQYDKARYTVSQLAEGKLDEAESERIKEQTKAFNEATAAFELARKENPTLNEEDYLNALKKAGLDTESAEVKALYANKYISLFEQGKTDAKEAIADTKDKIENIYSKYLEDASKGNFWTPEQFDEEVGKLGADLSDTEIDTNLNKYRAAIRSNNEANDKATLQEELSNLNKAITNIEDDFTFRINNGEKITREMFIQAMEEEGIDTDSIDAKHYYNKFYGELPSENDSIQETGDTTTGYSDTQIIEGVMTLAKERIEKGELVTSEEFRQALQANGIDIDDLVLKSKWQSFDQQLQTDEKVAFMYENRDSIYSYALCGEDDTYKAYVLSLGVSDIKKELYQKYFKEYQFEKNAKNTDSVEALEEAYNNELNERIEQLSNDIEDAINNSLTMLDLYGEKEMNRYTKKTFKQEYDAEKESILSQSPDENGFKRKIPDTFAMRGKQKDYKNMVAELKLAILEGGKEKEAMLSFLNKSDFYQEDYEMLRSMMNGDYAGFLKEKGIDLDAIKTTEFDAIKSTFDGMGNESDINAYVTRELADYLSQEDIIEKLKMGSLSSEDIRLECKRIYSSLIHSGFKSSSREINSLFKDSKGKEDINKMLENPEDFSNNLNDSMQSSINESIDVPNPVAISTAKRYFNQNSTESKSKEFQIVLNSPIDDSRIKDTGSITSVDESYYLLACGLQSLGYSNISYDHTDKKNIDKQRADLLNVFYDLPDYYQYKAYNIGVEIGKTKKERDTINSYTAFNEAVIVNGEYIIGNNIPVSKKNGEYYAKIDGQDVPLSSISMEGIKNEFSDSLIDAYDEYYNYIQQNNPSNMHPYGTIVSNKEFLVEKTLENQELQSRLAMFKKIYPNATFDIDYDGTPTLKISFGGNK